LANVLLTGASGFIGRELFKTLRAAGHRVTGTANRTISDGLLKCDLRDFAAVNRVVSDINPDIVVHCAAISGVISNNNIDYYASNVIGTENILIAITKLEKRVRLLFMSTAGVYGNQASEVLAEHMSPTPVHHYGLSKFACEQIIRNMAKSIDVTIVRPFNIIGAGQDSTFLVPKVVMAFAKEQREIRLGNIDVERDYVEVSTACAIIAGLLNSSASIGETINLCSGRSTSLRELISTMQDLAGYEIKVQQAAEFTRAAEVWRLVGSREKLDRLSPGRIQFRPLRETLHDMLQHYRADSRATA
jgi:GDP-6-deoxy-D-talose 4-dehydrogenase